MALKQCKLHYVSLYPSQNNSINASFTFGKKSKEFFDEIKNASRKEKKDILKNFAKFTEK